MKLLLKFLCVLFLTIILLGCQKAPTPTNPPAEDVITDVSTYFPIEAKLTWIFEGEGNEYASFTRRVMVQQVNRSQFAEDNGGTKMVMVYQVEPDKVKRTFFEPEFYSDKNMLNEAANQSEIILKGPLKVGSAWQDDKNKREVLGIREKVTVPAGTFENVVKIRITPLQGESQGSELFEYYAPNTGLILREFISGENFKVISKLKSSGKTEATILDQPQTKTGSITIEGTRQKMTLLLFDGAPLPFFTYIPQDMLVERISV